MIIFIPILFAMQESQPEESLPIDFVMERFDEALPELKEEMSKVEEEMGELGPNDPNWASSGFSVSGAIAHGKGDSQLDVLGEWEVGGHGVVSNGDFQLPVPKTMQRYSVRKSNGPIEYHSYHRIDKIEADVVIHYFGSKTKIGNAECHDDSGLEVISSQPWQNWSPEVMIMTFGLTRSSRDDTRTYCNVFRPVEGGRFSQISYTPQGEPYVAVNDGAQSFVVTSRAEAARRLFAIEYPAPISEAQ